MRSSDSITMRFQFVAELLQALEAAGELRLRMWGLCTS
jgi:hypothetical protein